MSVLVYIENTQGHFKKSAFEILSYGSAIASKLNLPLIALSIGKVDTAELNKAANYGASKILNASSDHLAQANAQSYATVVAEAAKFVNAKVIVLSSSFTGKTIAPRVSVKLNAGLVENAIDVPVLDGNSFVVKKGAFSGKAYAFVQMLSEMKVITVMPNSYKVVEQIVSPSIESFNAAPVSPEHALTVKETIRSTDKIALPEAELVVSAGRGLKGPENWGMIEDLASILGAATACSKPVSDAGWRPHSEHVGQTGIAISPNLYIAVGISGAIQHLAGVSSSKVIVVINKDPEAPFFKAADYGIVGDAFEVVPKLIEGAKAFKTAQG